MPSEIPIDRKRPRFFKEPSPEEFEEKGWASANIHARMRARIIGSRVLNAAVVFGTGTAITAYEVLKSGSVKVGDLLANYGFPLLINGLAEVKIERQLRYTEHDVAVLLPDILNDLNDSEDTFHPPNET